MRFHLVDRVSSYEPWKTVTASKLTSLSEDIWETRGTRLTMPESLILESVGQAGGWLILLSSEGRKRGLLLSIGELTVEGEVSPGDVLELSGRIDSLSDDAALMSGRATVGGTVRLEVSDLMCVLVDADTLEDPEVTRIAQQLVIGSSTA